MHAAVESSNPAEKFREMLPEHSFTGRSAECIRCGKEKQTLPRRPHGLKVVAEGQCAQGTAGYMGGGPEYLVVLRSSDKVTINRSGRLYGSPSRLRLELKDGIPVLVDIKAELESKLAAERW